MKYNDNHRRDFEGAKGTCGVCGLEITLDRQDSPRKPLDNTWLVDCPHCNNPVRCYQSAQQKMHLTKNGRGKTDSESKPAVFGG